MRTLGLIRAATPPPVRDLWPRLRARLGDDEARDGEHPCHGEDAEPEEPHDHGIEDRRHAESLLSSSGTPEARAGFIH